MAALAGYSVAIKLTKMAAAAIQMASSQRGLNGTYVAVEPMHLDRYLDEQMFRFNNRIGHNDGTRFTKALSQVANRRLTYAELTGKEVGSEA